MILPYPGGKDVNYKSKFRNLGLFHAPHETVLRGLQVGFEWRISWFGFTGS